MESNSEGILRLHVKSLLKSLEFSLKSVVEREAWNHFVCGQIQNTMMCDFIDFGLYKIVSIDCSQSSSSWSRGENDSKYDASNNEDCDDRDD